MQNRQWANTIKFHRQRLKLTSRKLAQKAGIDPSYITLMERDGCVPRREKVQALAEALEINADALLLVAGYAPEQNKNSSKLSNFGSEQNSDAFVPELFECVEALLSLPKSQQRKVADFLSAYIEAISPMPAADGKRRQTQ
ncbi:helix-turn-helix domain-containing protein [bacterium]|nr:helix-turn-helix domain-containing protein [bacterium]